jgi:actin-related protein
MFYSTHLKIGFGKNPKTILPLSTGRRASITATKIWFFEKPKTKSV